MYWSTTVVLKVLTNGVAVDKCYGRLEYWYRSLQKYS
jgi:hypothetical protein